MPASAVGNTTESPPSEPSTEGSSSDTSDHDNSTTTDADTSGALSDATGDSSATSSTGSSSSSRSSSPPVGGYIHHVAPQPSAITMDDQMDGDSGFAASGTPGCSRNMEALLQASRRLCLRDEELPEAHQPASKNGKAGKRKRATKRLPPSRLRSSTSGPAKAQKRKGRSSLPRRCSYPRRTCNLPLPLQPQRAANGSEAKGPQAERRNANRPGDSLAAAMTRPSGPALPREPAGAPPPPPKRNRRRGRRRQRFSRGPALLPLREPCDTILYRPLAGKANFLAHSQEAIAAQLSRVAGAHRVRVNFRLNIVAVDVALDASLDPLLTVTAICDVPVRATTAPAQSCTGYVFGVDPSINNDTLLANIVSDVAVLSCSRAGNNVILRFAGKNLPTEVSLYKLRRRVLPKRPRPRQCHQCGAYGHVTAACTFHRRCLRCGGEHATPECTAKQAKCLNCGGPHVATEPRCPNWQHERKVAETLVSSELPISRRQAADLVRSTRHPASQRPSQHAASRVPSYVQPGRSYSEAAGDHPTRPPVAGNTITPAPRPPVTSPDSRDAVIALLSAALAYATEFLPQDCPARPLCAAALAAHRALANHGS
ncbi:hypothetical protein HPB49_002074 [Dermacentor silvarum]|uniref:Uncharacterized protein n=1 Tax=Dermacentor silvarum TaxID=543639 RepID=A0ACB8CCS7_DERSI|nr:hypothetical protein HPB49_002074 [Dermacentor silvarum]